MAKCPLLSFSPAGPVYPLCFVLALAIIGGLALLASSDRKKILPRVLLQLVVIEAALAWSLLHAFTGLVLSSCHPAHAHRVIFSYRRTLQAIKTRVTCGLRHGILRVTTDGLLRQGATQPDSASSRRVKIIMRDVVETAGFSHSLSISQTLSHETSVKSRPFSRMPVKPAPASL